MKIHMIQTNSQLNQFVHQYVEMMYLKSLLRKKQNNNKKRR